MKCLACSGEIAIMDGSNHMDTRGVCSDCGGAFLNEETFYIAKDWCKCKDTGNQEVYFFRPSGAHGWLHTVCGQITQVG